MTFTVDFSYVVAAVQRDCRERCVTTACAYFDHMWSAANTSTPPATPKDDLQDWSAPIFSRG